MVQSWHLILPIFIKGYEYNFYTQTDTSVICSFIIISKIEKEFMHLNSIAHKIPSLFCSISSFPY